MVVNYRPMTAPVYCVCTVASNLPGFGTVTGQGTYREGAAVTVTATPEGPAVFLGWQVNGETVSTSESYTFVIAADTHITAVFVRTNAIGIATIGTATIDKEEA